MTTRIDHLPRAFIWRRLHSLAGLWIVLFLIEHLLTNSQAALWLGDSGQGFVRMVNLIHNLPYLEVIEIVLLGVPIGLHLFWGVRYLFTAKYNSFPTQGQTPYLNYGRNHAYTWQRITSWILLVLLTVHVVKFRFLEYPGSVSMGNSSTYYVKISMDPGLYTVAERLGVTLYDSEMVTRFRKTPSSSFSPPPLGLATDHYDPEEACLLSRAQELAFTNHLHTALAKVPLKENQILATTSNFGTATLLSVRDTFKSPYWAALYTVFVLSACFHGFNGLWTFLLTWGWVIKVASQRKALKLSTALMLLLIFLGLAAVWGTYFINLKT
jgi:succinate dehydrogenase / fumarate reductase cytochrome b subunit